MKPIPDRRARRAIAVLLFSTACVVAPCLAQAKPQVAEHRVKAAFLYQFLNYVEWPAHAFERADSPIVVGVIGADNVAAELATVINRHTARDRPVVARKLRADEPLAGVHMLFVGRSSSARLPTLLSSSNGQSMLTVTESEDAFAHGSAINFVVVDAHVRFDIALHAAERRNVKISSRLLAVARRVRVVPA